VRLHAQILFFVTIAAGFKISLAAQQASPTDARANAEVVMTGLFNPTYPPLARQARISGDVELKLEIRKDGSVQSATVVRGHPMLTPAALDSAQRSRFECRGCEDSITTASFFYSFSFQIAPSPGWPCPEAAGGGVTQSQNRITVMAEPALVDPYFAYTAARSAKCLYLWSCGRRWGGEDYYFYRVRSAKCLDLWSCGQRLREPFATCQKLHRQLSY
jgi:TonB family protein